MTDDPHPDLAGLVAAPLEPHERMVAAAARVKAVATLPVQLPMPLRSALAHFAASLAYVGEQHRDACLFPLRGLLPGGGDPMTLRERLRWWLQRRRYRREAQRQRRSGDVHRWN